MQDSPVERDVDVGIDVGGTFTDVIARDSDSGRFIVFKLVSKSSGTTDGVLEGIRRVQLEVTGTVASIIHGTTLATNALLEGNIARMAFVTTRGFRDVIEIGRQSRTRLYDVIDIGKSPVLVPRHLRLEVSERVDSSGNIIVPLVHQEIAALVAKIQRFDVDTVAVCLLHSYLNPTHERLLQDELLNHFPHVSVSSEVNAEFREYERSNTVIVNAALLRTVNDYFDDLGEGLKKVAPQATLHVIQSNGGMASKRLIGKRPITTVMSGPAGGVAATKFVMSRIGIRNGISLDMGGTSTDVCLISDGEPEVVVERELAGHRVRLRSIGIETIGAGGGSIARFSDDGRLSVGPLSAGAIPGPACYGRGGHDATVTDANLRLGYLSGRLGHEVRLDPNLAERALELLGKDLQMDALETARGIIDVANFNMKQAIRLVSVQKGYDVRDFALIAFGGAGPVHAAALARELGVRLVIVPPFAGVFSAFGCLISDVRHELARTFRVPIRPETASEVDAALAELESQGFSDLMDDGYPIDRILTVPSLDVRYVGQNSEIEIPLEVGSGGCSADVIAEAFHSRHEQMFHYWADQEIECVNVRVSFVVADGGQVDLSYETVAHKNEDALTGQRQVFFGSLAGEMTPVFDGQRLPLDVPMSGPGVIEMGETSTIVAPDQRFHMDRSGCLFVESRL